ncbi:conserved Plasmodium protein, unknown function [Plasmodium berghei]|uniref:Uncharacterized protein n=1 Tax=Plasmodium berghei TaxID=5821 RepID=A0A1D3LVV8_PLABE|nr:conserved Plasmodium protein, unknown function [Plasmodium berghei]
MKNYNSYNSRNKNKHEDINYNNSYNYPNNYYYGNNNSNYKKKINNRYWKGAYGNDYLKNENRSNNKNSDLNQYKKHDNNNNNTKNPNNNNPKNNDNKYDSLSSIDKIKDNSIYEDVDKINNITFGYNDNSEGDFSYIMNNNFIENEKKLFKLNNNIDSSKNMNSSEFLMQKECDLINNNNLNSIKRKNGMDLYLRQAHGNNICEKENHAIKEDKLRNNSQNYNNDNNRDIERNKNFNMASSCNEKENIFQFHNVSNLTKFINKNIFYSNDNEELSDEHSFDNADPFNFMQKDDMNNKKNISEANSHFNNFSNKIFGDNKFLEKNYNKKNISQNKEQNMVFAHKHFESEYDEKINRFSENKYDDYDNDENYKNLDYFNILKKKNMNTIVNDNIPWNSEKNIPFDENISEDSHILRNNINGDDFSHNNMNRFNASNINELMDLQNSENDENLKFLNKFRNTLTSLNNINDIVNDDNDNRRNREDTSHIMNDMNNVIDSCYPDDSISIHTHLLRAFNKGEKINFQNIHPLSNKKINDNFMINNNNKNDIDIYNLNDKKYMDINKYDNDNNLTNLKERYNDKKYIDLEHVKFNKDILSNEHILNVEEYLNKSNIGNENYYLNINDRLNNFKDDLLYFQENNNEIKMNSLTSRQIRNPNDTEFSEPVNNINVLNVLNEYYLRNNPNEINNINNINNNSFNDKISSFFDMNDNIRNGQYYNNEDLKRSNINNNDNMKHHYLHINDRNNHIYDDSRIRTNLYSGEMHRIRQSGNEGLYNIEQMREEYMYKNKKINKMDNNNEIDRNNKNKRESNEIVGNINYNQINMNMDKNYYNKNYMNDTNNGIKKLIKNYEKHQNYYYYHHNIYDSNSYECDEFGRNRMDMHHGILRKKESKEISMKNEHVNNSNYDNGMGYHNNRGYRHFKNSISSMEYHNQQNNEKYIMNIENCINKLKKQNMLKFTLFLREYYKDININDLSENLYNYYRFINQINGNIKHTNYRVKYQNLMQKSDKDKLLRIQLSYMIINPSIQKNSGKWNFKNDEKGKEKNKGIENNFNSDNNTNNKLKQIDKMENSNYQIFDDLNKNYNFTEFLKKDNISPNDITNKFLEDNDNNLNDLKKLLNNSIFEKFQKKIYMDNDEDLEINNKNIMDTNLYNLLNYSIISDNKRKENVIDEQNDKNIDDKDKNDDGNTKLKNILDDALCLKTMDNSNANQKPLNNNTKADGKDIIKYDNIKKLGRYVFATVHEPRNLITLIKNKQVENYDEIVTKIRNIIKNAVDHITDECDIISNNNNNNNDIIKYGQNKTKDSENISLTYADNFTKNTLIKKILEVLWDIYIDIKNLYKDIDKCPHTHIETISKYNEDIKKKKNTLFNIIYLNEFKDNNVETLNYFIECNNIFLNKSINNIDITLNKQLYLYLTNVLYNTVQKVYLYVSIYPDIENLIKNLKFDKDLLPNYVIDVINGSKENKTDSSTNNKIVQNEKQKMNKNKTGTNLNDKINENNIKNIFSYNFGYENNIAKMSNFKLFGKTIKFCDMYEYYNFENYNEYDIFSSTINEKKKPKKSSFFFKEKGNKKGPNTKNEESRKKNNHVHKEIKKEEIDHEKINTEICKIKSVYYLFVNSMLKNKGASIYTKIFKIIKKKKKKTLIYTLFNNYLLLYYILAHADICFNSKIEYEEFLKVQILHINPNVNTLDKYLKNEKKQNKSHIKNNNITEKNDKMDIRYKLYNNSIYSSIYIYLIDVSVSYLFTPNMGVAYIQNILSLFLFYNYINFYITKMLFYKSGAGLITILLVKTIPYAKEFDENLMVCFLYSVLHSIFYILSNIFIYHMDNEKKTHKGSESELHSKILASMSNEIDFYKILYKSVCSYSHQNKFYDDEIKQMIQNLETDEIAKIIMTHIQK